MNTTANIFTYSLDAGLLPYCVQSLLQADESMQIHVIDDANHPVPQEGVKALACMSDRVHYRRSTWARGGNLNGKPAALGILREMRISCGDRAGVSIKIDTDTLMLNAQWIKQCIANNVAIVYSLRPPVAPSGMCYLINNEWLPKIERAVEALDLQETCPEDATILSIGHALAYRSTVVCLLPQGVANPHGAWTAWEFGASEDVIPEIVSRIDVISLGNWKFKDDKSRTDAVHIADKMLESLNEIKQKQ